VRVHVGPPTPTVSDLGVDEDLSSIERVDLCREGDRFGSKQNSAMAMGMFCDRASQVSLAASEFDLSNRLAAQRERRERDRLGVRSRGTTNNEGTDDRRAIALVNGDGNISVRRAPSEGLRYRLWVTTGRAVQLACLDVALGLALIDNDGDEIRGAILVLHAVGLAARIDAPGRRDPVHVQGLQRPRSIGAGIDRHGVDARTEWHDFASLRSDGWITEISRVASHAGSVGKVERAGGETRQGE